MPSHRLHLIVSEQMHVQLKKVAKEEFITVSEYARRAIIHRLWQDVKRRQSLATLVMNAPSEDQLMELLKFKQEHSTAWHLRRAKMQKNEEWEAYLEEMALQKCDPEIVIDDEDPIKEIKNSY